MVHTGFHHIFTSMTHQLAAFMGKQTEATTVHCIGHSLGGAVASLCAEWVKVNYGKQVKLYTFGAPRVSYGPGFASTLETRLLPENIFRVYQVNDPVPMLPVFPFMHSPLMGKSYCLGASGGLVTSKSHSMGANTKNIGYVAKVSKAATWGELYQPAPVLSKASVEAWLSGDYDDNPNSMNFWNRFNSAFMYLVQGALGVVMPFATGAVTIADQLAMILQKGLTVLGETSNWAFLLIKKMMRALGMRVAETIEEITYQLIRMVLDRLLRIIANHVQRALDTLR